MEKFIEWCVDYWRENVTKIIAFLAVFIFLFYRIASLPNGYNTAEKAELNNLKTHHYSLIYLWHNVAFAPYYAGLVALRYIHEYNLTAIRSIGALFGLAAGIGFFYITWRWFGSLIAILATGLFVDSLWFFQSSRLSGPLSLYVLGVISISLIFFVSRNDKHIGLKNFVSILFLAAILYIPGMVWFVAIASIIQRNYVSEYFSKLGFQLKLALPAIWLILVSPIIWSSIHNLNVLKNILGAPLNFVPHQIIQRFYQLPLDLFARSYINNNFALGHLPVFDIFSIVMILLGLYYFWANRDTKNSLNIGIGLVAGWLLFSFGVVPIYVLLPLIMFILAAGLAYLMNSWFEVFPRNPVARGLGIALLSLGVTSVMWLHINQSYIAWPKTVQTLSTYSQHL